MLAGPANVIMQLARPGVGYGVLESRVESGRVDLHPIKRARTIFTDLAVATAGSDAQKEAFRRAVNRAHAQVYSTPESPVQYNAFDLDLQLWVGACLYKGGVDIYRTFIGELDDADADRHYREGVTLATTLQVPPEMWPADRAAFDRYWQESLAHHRLSAATVSRRDAVAVGRHQAAAVRPADGCVAHGEPAVAAVRPAVPVQRPAVGCRPTDQDGPSVGLAPAARDSPPSC